MITNEIRTELDKFYTKPEIAKFCFEKLIGVLNFISIDDMFFIEPSAGSGRLLDSITSKHKIGFDLVPERNDIIQADYLKIKINKYVPNDKICVSHSNVPFGKKSELAIKFINKLLKDCQFVGAIVPVEFNKFSVQSKINKSGKLIHSELLPSNSFTFGDKDKCVNCCFQIWTTKKTVYKNLKILSKPETTSSDFEMFQYNATDAAAKYFTYNWNFAVLRQGYDSNDFTKKYYSFDELKQVKNYIGKQWMFLKTTNEDVLKTLHKIDFQKLSEKNTSRAKGFGKADVIEEYNKLTTKPKKSISKFLKG